MHPLKDCTLWLGRQSATVRKVDKLRVLGAIRQSARRERGVSPAEQRRKLQEWADEHGHEIVRFTEDLARSGKLSAFKRPELGPWLTDPDKMVAWDILATTKIDRACRNTLDFLNLYQWCDANGKQYVSLHEQIDMTTTQGRQNARDAASRAEWERDMASDRRLDTIAELNEQGRWTGGRYGYGLIPEKREDGYYLVIDEDYTGQPAIQAGAESTVGKVHRYKGTADIARRMAADAIAGKSYHYIGGWLNAEGHLTNIGRQWEVTTVRRVLLSPNMALLLSDEDYVKLYNALHARVKAGKQWTQGRHWPLRVAFCAECKGVLYARMRNDVRFGGYYTCAVHGCIRQIGQVESEIEAELREIWGTQPYRIRQVIFGDSHAAEIHRRQEELKMARNLEFVDTARLEAKIAELKASHTPDSVELVDTDKTVAEHWDELDGPAERNRFLRDRDVKFLVSREGVESWSLPNEWIPRHLVRA